jgi:hypothetical protein
MTEDKKPVGYCSPPAHTRWQKGQSGNMQGRPKGSRNTYSLLNMIANKEVKVTQPDGKTIKISKKSAALMQAVNQAMKGDLNALRALLPHLIVADEKADERVKKTRSLSKTDNDIIAEFLNRNSETKENPNDENN